MANNMFEDILIKGLGWVGIVGGIGLSFFQKYQEQQAEEVTKTDVIASNNATTTPAKTNPVDPNMAKEASTAFGKNIHLGGEETNKPPPFGDNNRGRG